MTKNVDVGFVLYALCVYDTMTQTLDRKNDERKHLRPLEHINNSKYIP